MIDALHLANLRYPPPRYRWRIAYDERARREMLEGVDFERGVCIALFLLPGQSPAALVEDVVAHLDKAQPLDGHRAPLNQLPLPLEVAP